MKKLRSILVLVLPYAITMLLPMISVFCLGSMVITNYREKIVTDKQKSIESAFERFLQRMDNVETLLSTIAQNSVMTKYAYGSLGNSDHTVIENMEVRDVLHDFWTNDDVATMFFYDARDNRIITPNSVLSRAQDYFKYSYQLEGYTQEEWIESLKNSSGGVSLSSAMKVQLETKNTEVIEYRVGVPVELRNRRQSQLVLVMEVEDIFGDLYDVLDEGSEFYVYDNQEQLIFGNGSQYEEMLLLARDSNLVPVQGEDEGLYGIVCHSPDGYWKMRVYLPDLMKNGSSETMQPYVWLLMGVPLVVSMILCIYFTFRNHREIQEILQLFKDQREPDNEEIPRQESFGYKMIREYVGQIIGENNRFKESISRLEYSYKHEIFDKLLRNIYESREEMAEDLTKGELSIQDGKCTVLCIRFKDSSYRAVALEDITVKDFVKGLLGKIIERKFEIFDTASRELICVLPLDDENVEMTVQDIVSRLKVEIDYHCQIKVEIGVGNAVDSMYYLSVSYKQAKTVIRYQENTEKQVYLYSELVQLEDVYFYPREYDEKIYYYVITGQEQEAKEIIRKIYRENFEENIIMPSARAIEAIKGRLKELLNTLSRIHDISIDDKMSELNNEQNIKRFYESVCAIVDVIAEKIVNKKKTVQQHSALKIMEYINENYCDNMLSLKQISLALGMNESYVSRLFKNEYGENLSAVIERRRIEKACELIKNTEMKVSEIAEAVGYSSDVSFRRAFKKIMGVAPGGGTGVNKFWKN